MLPVLYQSLISIATQISVLLQLPTLLCNNIQLLVNKLDKQKDSVMLLSVWQYTLHHQQATFDIIRRINERFVLFTEKVKNVLGFFSKLIVYLRDDSCSIHVIKAIKNNTQEILAFAVQIYWPCAPRITTFASIGGLLMLDGVNALGAVLSEKDSRSVGDVLPEPGALFAISWPSLISLWSIVCTRRESLLRLSPPL